MIVTLPRLGKRLFGLTIAGIVLSYGILSYLFSERERAVLLEFDREKSSIVAESITRNLREVMLHGDASLLKNILQSENRIEGLDVAVFRSDGSPLYGRADFAIPYEIMPIRKELSLQTEGKTIFLRPIANEKECHGCHSPEDRTRGILGIRISTEGAGREIGSTAERTFAFGFVTSFLLGFGLIIMLRKMVLIPLDTLREGAQKIRDGALSHRIDIANTDEMGDLAHAFNQMAVKIENAQKGLEQSVLRKTKDLRVIAALSTTVFRGDLTLRDIVERFLASITDDLGYSFCTLCLVDKRTGIIQQEYGRGLKDKLCAAEISLSDDHPFVKTLREAKTRVRKAGDVGIPYLSHTLAIVPIISHEKKRCRDINLCHFAECPAYNSPDERCWLIADTLCRSPQAMNDTPKIYGCLHCDAFPLIGVLVAGRETEIDKDSLHSIEILVSEIAAAIENCRLRDKQKEDIRNLIRLHDVSVEKIQYLDTGELSASIVSSALSFAKADAAIFWLKGDDGTLLLKESAGVDRGLVPDSISIEGSFMGESIGQNRPVETTNTVALTCLGTIIERHGFHYAASVPVKGRNPAVGCLTLFRRSDFLMTESEKAITALFASQAAAAIHTARMYEELKAQKEFSDGIFENAVSGVLVLNNDGAIIRVNQSGSEILHLMAEEITGGNIVLLCPELKDMLVIDPTVSREATVSLRNGVTKTLGFSNSPFLDQHGNERGIIVVFRDISELKRLQTDLRKKQHFESMGKVIAGVAHEIRNPLFAIQSIAQLLDREAESPQHQALLQALLKETGRMRNLIEELLLYSRPSKLTIVEVDLEILLTELGEYAKTKNYPVPLSVDVQSPAIVRADRDKLLQVFLNLIDNAAGAGSRRIDVTVAERGGSLRVVVRDDGSGIKSADAERIFDPFFTTKKEGTGLGLPICKKIVEDHGGTLEIQSNEGGGTAVTLTFPC